MGLNIFVFGFPTVSSIISDIDELFGETVEKLNTRCRCCCHDLSNDNERDFTPKKMKNHQFGGAPLPQWGITGRKADEDLRFGAGFEIDEPRCEDYDKRWQFESDHKAYDRFVEAGEDCVARGLERKGTGPVTKCKAFRKRLGEAPPMNVDLIGETHWWDEPASENWF